MMRSLARRDSPARRFGPRYTRPKERKAAKKTLGRCVEWTTAVCWGEQDLALVSNAVMPLGRGRKRFPALSEPLSFGE